MKRIEQNVYGGPEVLTVVEAPTPELKPDHVLVRSKASTVNAGDWHVMRGDPWPVRLAMGMGKPRNPVRGLDLAGVVEAVGEKVTRFRPGDEVFGYCDGAFAELVAVREDGLAKKPANVSFAQAAATPVSGTTALNALQKAAKLQAGQRVLVVGAAGGVGMFGVQVAKALGAHVTAVCSGRNVERVKALGADEVVNRDVTPLETLGARFDVVLDAVGEPLTVGMLRKLAVRGGTLALVGASSSVGGMSRVLHGFFATAFVPQRLRPVMSICNPKDLETLRAMLEKGQLTPALGPTFPLAQTAEAVRMLETGKPNGKVMISFAA